jgi:hypothetical protein
MTTPAPDRVDTFREGYRATRIPRRYRGGLHLALTTSLALAAVAFAASHLAAPTLAEWTTVPASFLVANVAEYLGHRFPMHHRTPGLTALFDRHVATHHRFFVARRMHGRDARDWHVTLFPPVLVLFFLGALATPIGAALYFLVSPNVGWLFACTGVSYFVTYEWMHLAYHAAPTFLFGRVPLLGALSRHHQVHHDPVHMGRHNFNITFPIVDVLVGTRWRG